MDQVILEQKLESLRRCIKRVEEKTPSHVSELIKDQDIQDILVLNLKQPIPLKPTRRMLLNLKQPTLLKPIRRMPLNLKQPTPLKPIRRMPLEPAHRMLL